MNRSAVERGSLAAIILWYGKKLDAKKSMSVSRLATLRPSDGFIPLETLLAADALAEIAKGGGRAATFYAESSALRRYLQEVAAKPITSKFALWETMCRGAALGAEAGQPNSRNAEPESAHFHTMLGPDLLAIEAGLRTWLEAH